MGDPYLFTSIAAVAIGGASILGGSGHYLGTVAGALVLTILSGLLPALNLSSGALLIVYGAIILVTVVDRQRTPRRPRGALGPRQERERADMIEITCVVDARAELGEGTLWDPAARVLWWIDIWGPLIHRYDPATGRDDTWAAPEYLGCLGLRAARRPRRSPWRAASTSSIPATGSFDADRRPRGRPADHPLQRRQARPPGPLLVRAPCSRRPGKPIEFIGSLWRLDPDLSRAPDDRGHRLLQRPRLEPGQPHHVLLRQPRRRGLGLRLRPGDRRHREPPHLHRHDRDRRRRRRRHRRRRGLLLGDDPGHLQGLPLRSRRQADADGQRCPPTCPPAASSAARTSTSSTSPPPSSAAPPRTSPASATPAASSPSTPASAACRCRLSPADALDARIRV